MKTIFKCFFMSFAILSVTMASCSGSTNNAGDPVIHDDKYRIFELYVASGGTMTYEEWLDSIKGANGTSLLTGTSDPENQLGNNGDTYLNMRTWDVFVKSGDRWAKVGNILGSQGPKGEQGEPGADGTSVLTGNGQPSSELGKEGDSYIDLLTWDYYSKKANGWVKMGNIKGENGKDGITYIPVIFNNYDGTKLFEFYFKQGSTIKYDGPTPIRQSDWDGDEELTYTFVGWDKPLENIQEPTIFTAQYREKMYDVSFQNYDGTALYSTKVERGHEAVYVGSIPTRNDDSNLEWTFVGWDKPLTNIKANTIFRAQYYAPNAYECVFKNYDGTVLSTQYVGTGDSVVFEGTTPERADEVSDGVVVKYEFCGWDKSLNNIQEPTIFTAQYYSTNYYETKFVDYDGTLLYVTYVFEGGQAKYVGATPTREMEVDGHTITTYHYSGWSESLGPISKPTTFVAQYITNTYTGYKVTFKIGNAELYSYYCKEGEKARYPYDKPYSYDDENVYQFLGWDKSFENIVEDTVINAETISIPRTKNGEYPDSHVSDPELITTLSKIAENENGYIEYEGKRYFKYYNSKLSPSTYYSGKFYFNDGEELEYGNTYYFNVSPIKWKVLSSDNNELFVQSYYNLDCCAYGSSGTNYKNSRLRAWLNNNFLNNAFTDDSLIKVTNVDNSVALSGTGKSDYECEITHDKVFALSKLELLDEKLFLNDSARIGTNSLTDYYTALYMSNIGRGGLETYWSRTVYSDYYAYCVTYYGDVSYKPANSAINEMYYLRGVRPSLVFDINL